MAIIAHRGVQSLTLCTVVDLFAPTAHVKGIEPPRIEPVKLQCSHEFCAVCLDQVRGSSGVELRCPFCRAPITAIDLRGVSFFCVYYCRGGSMPSLMFRQDCALQHCLGVRHTLLIRILGRPGSKYVRCGVSKGCTRRVDKRLFGCARLTKPLRLSHTRSGGKKSRQNRSGAVITSCRHSIAR